jgi:hypothetical protein
LQWKAGINLNFVFCIKTTTFYEHNYRESNPLLNQNTYNNLLNLRIIAPIINQAVWRYVMRKNVDYLSKVAHTSYLEGLKNRYWDRQYQYVWHEPHSWPK